MAVVTAVTIKIKLAWWVMPYVRCVAWWAHVHGLRPDEARVTAMVLKGVRITAARG